MKIWASSSLTSRLLMIFVLTAVAAVILMASLFSRGLGSQWQRSIVPHLYQYVAYIRNDLGSPPNEQRAKELAERLPIQIQTHDLNNQIMLFTTSERPLPVDSIRFSNPRGLRHWKKHSSSDKASVPFENIAISGDRGNPILRLDFDTYRVFIEFNRLRGREHGMDELLQAVAGLALLLTLCYFAIRHLLKPIGRLQGTVQKISMGDLAARTHAKGGDDLARLSNSVDQMSGRIQQMLEAKRELLLAISHELRSPLTRARLATEMLEPSRYQTKLIMDIDEMENLICGLVESERLQTHVVLDLHSVDINHLIDDVVSGFDSPIDWTACNSPCTLTADPTRLQVLVRNLIDNALRYGKTVGQKDADVKVWLERSEKEIAVVVTDNGPGIDAQHLDSVTEPFYRPDASRTRQTGGMGLGLYLCLRIAEAHGGTLSIESPQADGVGVRATLRLPLPPHDM